MNTRSYKTIGAFFGILCLSIPSLAQETQPGKFSPHFDFNTTLEPGQFKITPSQSLGSFVMEANKAPLEPVLQAIVGLANRKLIISDEAKERLQKQTISIYTARPQTPEAAFTWMTHGFSWGKVGTDTYLLVMREKSATEIAAEEADQAKIKEKWQLPPLKEPEVSPDEPQQAPMRGRLYLLPAPLHPQP